MLRRAIKGVLKKVKDIAEVEIQKIETRKEIFNNIIHDADTKCFVGEMLVCVGIFGVLVWYDGVKGR